MQHPLQRLSTCFRPALRVALLVGLGAHATQAQTVSFAPAALYPMPGLPRPARVATADVNGDGKLDILTANVATKTIGLALNNGNGTFVTGMTFLAGGQPGGLAIADLNGDGRADIITAIDGQQIAVLLGLAGGNFAAPATYAVGVSNFIGAGNLVLADVNSDGRLDVVTANYYDRSVSVLPGTGLGTFGTAARFDTGKSSFGLDTEPWAVAVGDLNGDRRPDIVASDVAFHSVCVFLATATGFGSAANYTIDTGYPYALRLADVNGDGKLDILTANAASDDVAVLLNPGASGAFKVSGRYALGPVNSEAKDMTLADLNGDGRLDLATANSGANSAGVLLATGTGTFQPVVVVKASNYASGATISPNAIAAGDFNGDGKPDLALTDDGYSSPVSILLNSTAAYLATLLTGAGTSVALAPNPAHEVATLYLHALPAQVARVAVTLRTVVGAVVSRQEFVVEQGGLTTPLATATLPAGLYVVQLQAYDAGGQPAGALASQRLCVVR